MQRIYLDWAASAPPEKAVEQSIVSSFKECQGNPGSQHFFGRQAMAIIDQARFDLAQWLGVTPKQVLFTSGASESINWVITSYDASGYNIALSDVEHKATLGAAANVKECIRIPSDGDGRIILAQLEAILREHPKTLVSVMVVNNETGNIENIAEIAKCVQHHPLSRLHIDATASLRWQELASFGQSWHLLSASAHKIGGIKGSGILVNRSNDSLRPLINGGGQEFGLRAGTQNVYAIGAWSLIAKDYTQAQIAHIKSLKDELVGSLGRHKNVLINSDLKNSAGHIINFGVQGIAGDELMIALDLKGVAVATGAACSSGALNPSHVLLAMGQDIVQAKQAVRVSFGPSSTMTEIRRFVTILEGELARLVH